MLILLTAFCIAGGIFLILLGAYSELHEHKGPHEPKRG